MTNQTTSNKISMDKKYKTRDGRDAIIESIYDNIYEYPVHASVEEQSFSFTEEGFFYSDKTLHHMDLIEIQEESSQPTETQEQPAMYQMIVETPNRTFKSILMTEDEANDLSVEIQQRLSEGKFSFLTFRESDSKMTIIQGDILKQSIIFFVKVQG